MRAALLARTGLAVLARFRKLPSPRHPCSGITGVGYISHILELCWVLLGQRWVKVIISAAYGYYMILLIVLLCPSYCLIMCHNSKTSRLKRCLLIWSYDTCKLGRGVTRSVEKQPAPYPAMRLQFL